MSYGFEVFDSEGELTATSVRTFRLMAILTIGTTSGSTQTVSLAGVSYSGSPFIVFQPSDTPGDYYDDAAPTISLSGTTLTVTSGGISGTAYIGVT